MPGTDILNQLISDQRAHVQMATPQKGGSSSDKLKEKSSLLDLDIGNDFLTSWKSTSVAEDIDFDFGAVTKGKTKAFSFDKMDMDFNLDGDFGKISSFKVDMSDLDISSDPKKQENQRKGSKEVSSGESHQGKNDRFAFSFNFDELGMSFDSTSTKQDKISKKNQEKEIPSRRSESEGSGVQFSDDAGAPEITQKLPASKSMSNLKSNIQLARVEEIDSLNEDTLSNSLAIEKLPLKSDAADEVAVQGTRTSPEKTDFTTTGETIQECGKSTSSESYAEEALVITQETGSNLQEVSNVPSEGQNVITKSVTGFGSNCKIASSKYQPPQSMISLQNDDHALVSDRDGTKPAESNVQLEHTSVTIASVTEPNGENQNLYAKLLSTPLKRGRAANRSVQETDKETSVIRSKFFKRVGETESHKNPSSIGSKLINSVEPSHTDGNKTLGANDSQSGSKLVSISRSESRDPVRTESVVSGSQESDKSLSSTWEVSSTDNSTKGCELLATSRTQDQNAKKEENVPGEKNKQSLTTFSPRVNLPNISERKNKSSSQDFAISRLAVSSMKTLQTAKKNCVEKNNISPPNPNMKTNDLSKLRIPRDRGSNPDILKSRFQKDASSLGDSGQIMKLQGNRESKIAHSPATQKQISPAFTLKRKTFEKPDEDSLPLNPAKRLSQSPKENRNVRDLPERGADKQFFNHQSLGEDNMKNVNGETQNPTLSLPRDVKMTEFETESNAENAEAYNKELEDICNMLKKKNEEAKELLVRAIVNNNNLLMLNHPIYDEKISMVQKFAALLLSN